MQTFSLNVVFGNKPQVVSIENNHKQSWGHAEEQIAQYIERCRTVDVHKWCA